MNSAEFTTELNTLIGKALKEGVDKREMAPAEIVGALELQKHQAINMFLNMAAAARAARQSKLVVPATTPPPAR
jgi:hypothetical protein